LPHAYVLCTDKSSDDPFVHFARQARDRGWAGHELHAGHFPMLTTPRELSELLGRLVAASRPLSGS
jgi:hypothetical protein